MTDTLTISDLRALKLTEDEWSTLCSMDSDCYDPSLIGGPMRKDIDMLVLAGLLERHRCMTEGGWIDRWTVTESGRATAAMVNRTLDWADFAHVEVA
jgi:hypothetical protein